MLSGNQGMQFHNSKAQGDRLSLSNSSSNMIPSYSKVRGKLIDAIHKVDNDKLKEIDDKIKEVMEHIDPVNEQN